MTVSKTFTAGEVTVRYEADTIDELFALVSRFETDSDDGWIPWGGGGRPVSPDARVQTIERRETMDNFDAGVRTAKYCDWQHANRPWDITAYRVVS